MKAFNNLNEIREEIDRLDALITPLLMERIACVKQAAFFKKTRDDVRLPKRIEFIINQVRTKTEKTSLEHTAVQDKPYPFNGNDPDFIEQVYRFLMNASIAREEVCWDTLHAQKEKEQ